MLSAQVYDVIDATSAAIAEAAPSSVDAVRAAPPLVCFSGAMHAESQQLKRFLMDNLYHHPQVAGAMEQARRVVRDLFGAYLAEPRLMKPRYAERALDDHIPPARARVVADFIAGMTDRYAAREHERLTGQRLLG